MNNDLLIPTDGEASVVTSLIRINGSEVPGTFEVLSMVVMKEVNRLPFAKIVLKDGEPALGDFLASNDDLFAPGNEIEVLVGYNANEDLLFEGIIVQHGIKIRSNGTSQLKLVCRDKSFKATLVPQNRYFTEVKDSEVIEEILGAYNLDLDVDSTDITHQDLVQYEQTDWQFALSLAEANGFLCLVDDGAFSLKKPDFDGESLLTLTYGASILEFDGEIDARQQYANVAASSWDPADQELLEVEALEPELKEPGNIKATDLAAVGDNPVLTLRHSGQVAQDELQSWADAQLLKIRLAKLRGRVKFHGSSTVKLNSLVTLQGVGDRFNGLVFVSGVRHEVQEGTWLTDVQFGLPEKWMMNSKESRIGNTRSPFQEVPGLQIGVVTQLEGDPEGEHRILVKLPIVDHDAEGIWARIATLDAGKERGTFFLPEVGDEVIVGFIQSAPRDPVVLGMLHSSKNVAPFEASKDNFEKGYVSKNGIKLLFNDEKESLSIETPSGKKILLDDDKGVLQLIDENKNKIVMDSNGIVIESTGTLELKAKKELKIDGATDLKLKAGASFKAEGAAGAELSTSGVAVLKGSLVQIN